MAAAPRRCSDAPNGIRPLNAQATKHAPYSIVGVVRGKRRGNRHTTEMQRRETQTQDNETEREEEEEESGQAERRVSENGARAMHHVCRWLLRVLVLTTPILFAGDVFERSRCAVRENV